MKKFVCFLCAVCFFQFVVLAQDSEKKKLSVDESRALIEPQIQALFKDHLVDFFIIGAEFHDELLDYERGDLVIEIAFFPYKSRNAQDFGEKITQKMVEAYKIIYASDAPVLFASVDCVLFIMDKYGNDRLHKIYFTSMLRGIGKRINWERAALLDFHGLWKKDSQFFVNPLFMKHAPK